MTRLKSYAIAFGTFAIWAGSAWAQNAASFDQRVVATHPLLEAGKLTGHVVASHTTGCTAQLTLDNGQSYAVDLAKRGVAMNAMLMIGDGDDTIGLTYQGDGARAAAAAAEAAMGPLSDKCAG